MPNNCSTLIQRKQNILHKVLRSNSDGKLQNGVAQTTAGLHVAGTRKNPAYSSSANHLAPNSPGVSTPRRSNLFATNRFQPSTDYTYETYLPSIRDASGSLERQYQLYDEFHSRPRAKTPLANTSPKSTGRPPSASMSSIFNTFAKRSTENLMSSNGEIDEIIVPSPVPPSRRSRRPSNRSSKYATGANQHTTKQSTTPQKPMGDSGIDIRFSATSADTNQQRLSALSARLRSTVPNVQIENPVVHETVIKERTSTGQLYQRRTNNAVKAPIKQKIDKYRRRSEEVTQATHGNTVTNTANAGISGLAAPSPARSKPPSVIPSPVRRVTSDGEIQTRLEVLRVSMDTNLTEADQQNLNNRAKSPYLYTTHQQLVPPTTASTLARRNHGSIQPTSSAIPSQRRQTSGINYRRQQSSVKQSTNTGQGNLYLAFIASRHLSSLEDTLFECDLDHPKLLLIFAWLKNVEENRHDQSDHDKLLIEQNQRMLDQEDNLSLYSEIQYAVDDLPANTTGKPCEKIATMQFED